MESHPSIALLQRSEALQFEDGLSAWRAFPAQISVKLWHQRCTMGTSFRKGIHSGMMGPPIFFIMGWPQGLTSPIAIEQSQLRRRVECRMGIPCPLASGYG